MGVSKVLLPAALSIALMLALYVWGVWVARRQQAPVFRWAKRGILVGTCSAFGGAALALRQLGPWNTTPHAGDPGASAAQLSQSISRAFTLAALPVGLGSLLLLASVVVLIVGTVRTAGR
jgi:hypothetical protein